MKELKVSVKNENEASRFGELIGKNLSGGEVIELIGPLAAGKTTIAKGILKGVEVDGGFSPTFILDAVYKTEKTKGLKEVHHLDLYRLKDEKELVTLGIYDLIGRPEVSFIIEWADRFPISTKVGKMTIVINVEDKNERSLLIKTKGKRYEKILDNISNNFD